MAQAKKTGRLFGAVTGAALAASAMFTPFTAAAQDTTPANLKSPTVTEQMRNAELEELGRAGSAVANYARQTENGVGILLHVGDDLRARAQAAADKHGVTPEHALNVMVTRLAEHYAAKFGTHGVETSLFPTTNYDARATGLSYHIREVVYEDENGNPLLNLKEASTEIPRVVEALEYLRRTARLDANIPTPNTPEIGG